MPKLRYGNKEKEGNQERKKKKKLKENMLDI